VTSAFLLDKWLLKKALEEGCENGIIREFGVSDTAKQNLLLIKELILQGFGSQNGLKNQEF
jgi:hypothetical protein